MRLGFGKNSGKFNVAMTLIIYNTAGSSYTRWLHNTLFSENSHSHIVIAIAYTQAHVVTRAVTIHSCHDPIRFGQVTIRSIRSDSLSIRSDQYN